MKQDLSLRLKDKALFQEKRLRMMNTEASPNKVDLRDKAKIHFRQPETLSPPSQRKSSSQIMEKERY